MVAINHIVSYPSSMSTEAEIYVYQNRVFDY